MKEIGDVTFCVVDHGLFVSLAEVLSRQAKRVLYHSVWEKGAPLVNDCCIGDGIEGIERCDDFWPLIGEIDCFVFPDIQHGGLQEYLREDAFPVWGSGHACDLENKRAWFKEQLSKMGLEVGPFEVIKGMTNLRLFLKDKKDCFVKLSKYRGSMETWHWVDWDTSAGKLDELAVKFGPLQDCLKFLVEDKIETKVEWGYDGYFAGSKFPRLSAQGPEIKDKCYAAHVVPWDELPEQVRMVNDTVAPLLDRYAYANFFSTELRITEDDKVYFIDPCCRVPSPAGEAQMELYGNLPEIIWAGAHGWCIDPEPTAQYCVEAIIDHTGDTSGWRKLRVSKDIRKWVKLYAVCESNGFCCIPPFPTSSDSIGAILGIGDTMEEAIEHLKANAEGLKDEPVSIHMDSLMDALREIREAKKQGVEFSSDRMPEPESVLADA